MVNNPKMLFILNNKVEPQKQRKPLAYPIDNIELN